MSTRRQTVVVVKVPGYGTEVVVRVMDDGTVYVDERPKGGGGMRPLDDWRSHVEEWDAPA